MNATAALPPFNPWEVSEESYQSAKTDLSSLNLGFFISKEENLWDMDEGVSVPCVNIDRIGPPAMMHAWTPGPINDRLCGGHRAAFVEWVGCLRQFVNTGRSDWFMGPR